MSSTVLLAALLLAAGARPIMEGPCPSSCPGRALILQTHRLLADMTVAPAELGPALRDRIIPLSVERKDDLSDDKQPGLLICHGCLKDVLSHPHLTNLLARDSKNRMRCILSAEGYPEDNPIYGTHLNVFAFLEGDVLYFYTYDDVTRSRGQMLYRSSGQSYGLSSIRDEGYALEGEMRYVLDAEKVDMVRLATEELVRPMSVRSACLGLFGCLKAADHPLYRPVASSMERELPEFYNFNNGKLAKKNETGSVAAQTGGPAAVLPAQAIVAASGAPAKQAGRPSSQPQQPVAMPATIPVAMPVAIPVHSPPVHSPPVYSPPPMSAVPGYPATSMSGLPSVSADDAQNSTADDAQNSTADDAPADKQPAKKSSFLRTMLIVFLSIVGVALFVCSLYYAYSLYAKHDTSPLAVGTAMP